MIELRPYQTAAIAGVLEAPDPSVVVLPTGTGKTITGIALAKQIGGRCLWLAHRKELIEQPIEPLRALWPSVSVGVVKAEQDDPAADFVLASVQTAWRPKRRDALGAFDLLIVDECHHAPAASYRSIIDAVPHGRLVGLTATPERSDLGGLDAVFARVAYQYPLLQAIADGYLAPVEPVTERIRVNMSAVDIARGDFASGAAERAMLDAGVIQAIVDAMSKHMRGRKTLLFAVGVEQARKTSEALAACGFRSACVSGETPSRERGKILRDFAAGRLDVICNCMVLTEGFDEPSITGICMARPTQSKTLYTQAIGRGLRRWPGKTECRVLDLVDASRRHTLYHAPVLLGIDAGDAEPRTETEAELLERDPAMYWHGRLRGQLRGVPSIQESRLRWLVAKDGVFALPCGNFGTILLRQDSGGWGVELVGRSQAPVRLTSGPVSAELAQGIAEDYVRRVGDISLAQGGGRWRSLQISEPQKRALARFGVTDFRGLDRGTASDLLTAKIGGSWHHDPATDKQIAALKRLGVAHEPGITKRQAGGLLRKAAGR